MTLAPSVKAKPTVYDLVYEEECVCLPRCRIGMEVYTYPTFQQDRALAFLSGVRYLHVQTKPDRIVPLSLITRLR